MYEYGVDRVLEHYSNIIFKNKFKFKFLWNDNINQFN